MKLYFNEINWKVPVARNETKKLQFNWKIYTFSFKLLKKSVLTLLYVNECSL